MNKLQIVSIKFSYVLLLFTVKSNTEKRTKQNTKTITKTKQKRRDIKLKLRVQLAGNIGPKQKLDLNFYLIFQECPCLSP